MNLTTLERLLELDNTFPNGKEDNLLNMIIKGVSYKVAQYMGRKIQIGEYTEIFHYTKKTNCKFQLQAAPLTGPLVEVKDLIQDVVLDLDEIKPFSLYSDRGWIQDLFAYDFTLQGDSFSVTYTGGMATDTADFIAKYPEIEYEVLLQCLFEYKRKKTISVSKIGNSGTNAEEYYAPVFRKELIRAIRPYRLAFFG